MAGQGGTRRRLFRRGGQRTFRGADLLQIAMPLGGLGAGCVCLNGHGGLQDFSIRNRPATSAGADGHGSSDAAFALLHVKGRRPVTRLVEGALPAGKIYNLGLRGQGCRVGGFEGLPRFDRCSFRGEYPFGRVALADPAVPLRVEITGWSPFIPGDARDSGLPCAVLEYAIRNPGRRAVAYEFSYHLSDLTVYEPKMTPGACNEVMPGTGVCFRNAEHANGERRGTAALALCGGGARVKGRWFAGGWWDAMEKLWSEASTASFEPNDGAGVRPGCRNGGSVLIERTLGPGESATHAVVIAWHFPNVNVTAGRPACPSDCACGADAPAAPKWRPYYAGQWRDARAVAEYALERYDSLRARTAAFHDALFSSTLPPCVLDAVSANLGILKSPTVLRQENGNVWGWEGCFSDRGCCHGTCTHVWNYAQAMPHLFPALERTLRGQELERSLDERGHATFRAALPDGPTGHEFHAASDGQLGGILKLLRDWHISGDHAWLERLYPLARRSIEYCIRTWDPRGRGLLEEPHHNTYDIEFWGPESMCSTFYIAALHAMARMAREMQEPRDAARYGRLARKGERALDGRLFNGEYYEQKVTWRGLNDRSVADRISAVTDASPEEDQVLKREGPKYQFGSGCLADGVIGAWMARACGLDEPLGARRVREHLRAIFRHNFKPDLHAHANRQRPGYAIGHEPGLILCTWPRGGRPTFPFPYSDEVWTGIEYQVASHMIWEGMVDEGLTIVRAARSRYDGRVRNPWNEYECGNYYARAMSSYALLAALSGFRYSAATRTLWFGPRLDCGEFRTFFAAASGWGVCSRTVRGKRTGFRVEVRSGELAVARLMIPLPRGAKSHVAATLDGAAAGVRVVASERGRSLEFADVLTVKPGSPLRVLVT